jgi:hypothetical protein
MRSSKRRTATIAAVRVAFVAVACILAGLSAGAAAAKTLPGITSPSGNIRCLLVTDKPAFLLCDIEQASYVTTLTHHCASAPYFVDWAGFSLGATGKGVVACAGGMAYDPAREHPSYAPLAYGAVWREGGFTCRSAITGITCTSPAGHSLFLSRQAWRAS